jgi:hypothetical protein
MPWSTMHQDLFKYMLSQIILEASMNVGSAPSDAEGGKELQT